MKKEVRAFENRDRAESELRKDVVGNLAPLRFVRDYPGRGVGGGVFGRHGFSRRVKYVNGSAL